MVRDLLAELHHRLSSPLLALAYTMVALACLLSGEFNRRGQSVRVTTAVLVVMAIQSAVLGLSSLAAKVTVLVPLMYVLPVAALVPAAWILSRNLRRRVPPGGEAAAG